MIHIFRWWSRDVNKDRWKFEPFILGDFREDAILEAEDPPWSCGSVGASPQPLRRCNNCKTWEINWQKLSLGTQDNPQEALFSWWFFSWAVDIACNNSQLSNFSGVTSYGTCVACFFPWFLVSYPHKCVYLRFSTNLSESCILFPMKVGVAFCHKIFAFRFPFFVLVAAQIGATKAIKRAIMWGTIPRLPGGSFQIADMKVWTSNDSNDCIQMH